MPIPYFVYQAPLGGKSRSLGRLLFKGTCDRKAVVNRMLSMGSSLAETDITAVLQLLTKAVGHLCDDGYRVDLEGLVKITPTLGGAFEGLGDSFQSPRNSVYLTAQVSKALNTQFSRGARVKKVITQEDRPLLAQITDSEAEPGSLLFTVGHIVSVAGKRLKFDPARPGEYLRLVNTQDPDDFLPILKFHKITQGQLVFRFPAATFPDGYFELASHLGSTTLRVGQSRPIPVSGSS